MKFKEDTPFTDPCCPLKLDTPVLVVRKAVDVAVIKIAGLEFG